jgi:hypothetical protein
MATFQLSLIAPGGVGEGQRAAYAPQPKDFDSLVEAQKAIIPVGFTAVIDCPDGNHYVFAFGKWDFVRVVA